MLTTGLAGGRKTKEWGGYQLQGPFVPYGDHFVVKKDSMGPENTYFRSVNDP